MTKGEAIKILLLLAEELINNYEWLHKYSKVDKVDYAKYCKLKTAVDVLYNIQNTEKEPKWPHS